MSEAAHVTVEVIDAATGAVREVRQIPLQRARMALSARVAPVRDRLHAAAAAAWKLRAEILLGLAVTGGWALVTWGVASLLVWQVWPISGGLFLLSLSGWRYLRTLFAAGLYALSRGPRR